MSYCTVPPHSVHHHGWPPLLRRAVLLGVFLSLALKAKGRNQELRAVLGFDTKKTSTASLSPVSSPHWVRGSWMDRKGTVKGERFPIIKERMALQCGENRFTFHTSPQFTGTLYSVSVAPDDQCSVFQSVETHSVKRHARWCEERRFAVNCGFLHRSLMPLTNWGVDLEDPLRWTLPWSFLNRHHEG